MENGQKTTNRWIGAGIVVFIAIAGWSVWAGHTAQTDAAAIKSEFYQHQARREEREDHLIYRLDEMNVGLNKLEAKVDQLLKRE